jgi:hypothetical protein
VAYADEELTVKTLRLGEDGKYFLEAANPAYKPIHTTNSLELLGVVVSVVRRVRWGPPGRSLQAPPPLGVWATEGFEKRTGNFDLSGRRWLHFLDPDNG